MLSSLVAGVPFGIVGADGDDERVDRGVGEPAGRRPRVACRGDDDDAVPPGLFGGVGQRVERVGLRRVRPERQVHDADVHAGVVRVLHDPVDPRDDLRDVADAVRVGDLDADDAGVRGHAEEVVRVVRRARRVGDARVVAGDDPGQVRAVAERVDTGGAGVLRLLGQVGAEHDVGRQQAGDLRDAGVDERDIDAAPGVAGLPVGAGADDRSRGCTSSSCRLARSRPDRSAARPIRAPARCTRASRVTSATDRSARNTATDAAGTVADTASMRPSVRSTRPPTDRTRCRRVARSAPSERTITCWVPRTVLAPAAGAAMLCARPATAATAATAASAATMRGRVITPRIPSAGRGRSSCGWTAEHRAYREHRAGGRWHDTTPFKVGSVSPLTPRP